MAGRPALRPNAGATGTVLIRGGGAEISHLFICPLDHANEEIFLFRMTEAEAVGATWTRSRRPRVPDGRNRKCNKLHRNRMRNQSTQPPWSTTGTFNRRARCPPLTHRCRGLPEAR